MIENSGRLESLLTQLNGAQRDAVETRDGQVLVVAGAGSGKTRVITYRIATILLSGVAVPYEILALTFTNKAAGEMKSRVQALAGDEFKTPLISTFHAFGSLFLRRHITVLGYPRDFLIYDEDDQLSVLKECCRELNLNDTRYEPRELQHLLKWHKSRRGADDVFDANIGNVIERYNRKLREAGGVDFDDLLHLPLKILREHPEIQQRYQRSYRYLMVDEYQDTNEIQYDLLKTLAGPNPNLLVVGDEDQSIYKFRGAKSENIQHFLRDFPGARLIKLEQNYRSTKTIIKAAQSVIANNSTRIKKELWTDNPAGEPVEVYHAYDEYDEATFITLRVMSALKQISPGEIAVLYRANAQSRALEESFGKAQIPHRIVGSVGFYERREIKDVIAFLRLMVNRNDPVSFLRVVNVPPRGVGKKMLQDIQQRAAQYETSLFDAARDIGGRSLTPFLSVFQTLPMTSASTFLENFLQQIGYFEYLRKEDLPGFEDRMENIREFQAYLRENEAEPDFDLARFVSELPLQSRTEEKGEAVTLLTVHSAKGLEFRALFVAGLEEGLFPHIRSMDRGEDIEEERRLFYVAMTRAREKLTLSWAQRRGIFGSTVSNRPSRFLEEIPGWFKKNQLSERFNAPAPPRYYPLSTGPAPAPVQATDSEYRQGSIVSHEKFGRGTVLSVEGAPHDWKLTIRFADGVKKIMTRYAQLTILR